jgi:uncharacterized protein (TIGR03118 family)
MDRTNRNGSRAWYVSAALVAIVCLLTTSTAFAASGYKQKNLVSDVDGMAKTTDPNLVNAWGLAFSSQGTLWVSAAGTKTSTVYKANGNLAPSADRRLVVDIPSLSDEAGSSGVIFNGSDNFTLTSGEASGPAIFIFAGLDGRITGWNPDVDATNAVVAADRSAEGAHYTGLAISDDASTPLLFAANFAGGTIDVFDTSFQFVRSFTDPNMEEGYSPFNIVQINGQLFVAYARPSDDGDEETGPGLGIIDIFDFDGNVVRRFAEHGTLNAPWGMALAPSRFGEFSNMVLIGNFGDGHIGAFDMRTGELKGQLAGKDGTPIEIEGLWGLTFGVGAKANTLFFAAGIDDEEHGLVGTIRKQGKGNQ